eukprot:TRINITY_DN12569_c0_g1_i2.p1 TRINITY_DN12569_c0_g1~~TRINITY_DN12569_c0_g1_i2.p1  ORF type:complete len:490 (+),score=107.74 TRINITY_DN12569_c0_g1_i2:35-1504(+)
MDEFLLIARSQAAKDGRGMSCHAWDLNTDVTLNMFKSNAIRPHTLWAGRNFFCAALNDKGSIVFWRWNTENPEIKMPISERITALACDASGTYCIAGSASGAIYAWMVQTGRLLTWLKGAHYRAITTITLTTDSIQVITAGEDAMVRVWYLAHLVSGADKDYHSVEPCVTLKDHSLAVTATVLSKGLAQTARLYTASRDRHVHIYQLSSHDKLASLNFVSDVTALALHPAESILFVGLGSGQVARVPLYDDSLNNQLTARHVDGTSFQAHQQAISAMVMTSDGIRLITASLDGTVSVWDAASGQTLKTLNETASIAALAVVPTAWRLAQGTMARAKLPLFQRRQEPDTSMTATVTLSTDSKVQSRSEHLKEHQDLLTLPLSSMEPTALSKQVNNAVEVQSNGNTMDEKPDKEDRTTVQGDDDEEDDDEGLTSKGKRWKAMALKLYEQQAQSLAKELETSAAPATKQAKTKTKKKNSKANKAKAASQSRS